MLFSRRFRWAWLICLLLLAAFLTNSISSYLVSRKNVRRTITESSLPLTSDNVYSEIQRDLLQPVFISSLMAHDTFLRDWVLAGEQDEDAITRYLHEIRIRYSTVTSFFVSDRTRKYYQADGLLKEVSEENYRDEWYFRVRDMKDPYEINVDPDLANKDEMTIFINHRVLDYRGNFIGAAGVGLTVNRVNNLISNYEAKFQRQIYFADPTGKLVLRPSNSPMLEYGSLHEVEGLDAVVPDLLAGNRVNVAYERGGKTRLLNARYVPELKWFLIVEQSEFAMLAPYRRQLASNILISLITTVAVAWICIITIRRNQDRLEARNAELIRINERNDQQKADLEQTTQKLEAANKFLHDLNTEKDEFISIVAHDLRSPLNGILGHCELASVDDTEFDRREFIDDIQACGERMLNLTQTLLNASQIEAFHGTLALEEVALNPLVEHAEAHFHKHALRKKINLQIDLHASRDLHVPTHPHWLSVCIDNLMSNAIKYTPHYGKVSVRSRRNARDSNYVDLCFEDDGPGVSEEDQHKLFGKFVRLSAKPTGNEPSTGLGLYVVKKMCNRLGVRIKVDSQLGEGATFTLSIPLDVEARTVTVE